MKRRVAALLATAGAAIGLAFAAVVPAAQAAPVSSAPNPASASVGFVSYANLGSMSPSFISQAEYGIAHLSPASQATALAALPVSLRAQTAQMADAVTPDSANGCNQDVCIDIVGSGRVVNDWNTQAFGDAGCINAIYWLTPHIFYISPKKICSNGQEGVYYYDYPNAGLFNNGAQLCNTWTNVAGKPCEKIEA